MKRISLLAASAAFYIASSAMASPQNHYVQTNLIASDAKYAATVETDKKLVNAWGIAIRPAGAGGHFWVAGKDTSFQYIGDVHHSEEKQLRKLHWDAIKYVKLPVGGEDKFATGVVFSDSKKDFVITQEIGEGIPPVTAPAKFLFASDGGIISAWTERKKEDGSFDRSSEAVTVIDHSKQGAQFFGLALSKDYDRLYVADFGARPAIKVFDRAFKPLSLTFEQPFDDNKNGKVDAGEYAPFNVQALTTPEGKSHIFVAYAKTQHCPKEMGCKKGDIFAGEEDTSNPGQGRLAEFTEDGKLVAVWQDGGKLNAPWGVVFAPQHFGALSGKLLVANFGDGTIAAYDAKTRKFSDFVKDERGEPVVIDKIWGLIFGNGASLGDKNALYFSAGPEEEKQGIFGSLRPASAKR